MAVSNTPNIGLNLPSKSEQNWNTLLNQNFDKIDYEINNNKIDIGDITELQTENKDNLVQATNELASQMADIAINVNNFGAKGDGVTNDYVSIQNAINSFNGKIGRVLLPSESYVVNESIVIPSNVHLIGENTKIINNATASSDGLFNVTGSIDPTTYNLSTDALKGTSVLTFTALPPVTVGDALSLTQTGSDVTNSYYLSVVKIESIDSGVKTITLESPLMHDYYTSLEAKVQKVTLSKNVTIDGFEFIMNTTQDLSPIKLWCSENVTVQNIKATGFGGNAIELDSCLNFTIENIKAKNPSNVDPGRGYAVMVHQGSSLGVISNVYGYKTRHTVDIAGGSHSISVVDCIGVKNTTQCFGLHGQHERNITFQGCKAISCADGGFTIGNASYGRSEQVNLVNCTAYFCNIGFYIILSDDINLTGCKSYRSTTANFAIDNSNYVTINGESVGKSTQIQRSNFVNVIGLVFLNIPASEDPLWIFNNAKNINISNSHIQNSARYGIQIGSTVGGHLGVEKITVDNCNLLSGGEFCMLIRANAKEVSIQNNTLNATTGGSIYTTSGSEKLVISENIITGTINNSCSKNVAVKNNVGSFSITNTNTTNATNGVWVENNYNWVV